MTLFDTFFDVTLFQLLLVGLGIVLLLLLILLILYLINKIINWVWWKKSNRQYLYDFKYFLDHKKEIEQYLGRK